MPRSVIVADALPPAPGPYSYAVQAGGWVFTAGLSGFDRTGAIAGASSGPVEAGAQTRQALDNLATALAAVGVPLAHVAKVKGYLTDFGHAAAYNAAYRDTFAAPWPARATAGAALVGEDAVVALEAIASVAGPPQVIHPAGRADPPVPLSQGMQAAGVLLASGQLARDASGVLIGRGDLAAQAGQALDNLGTVLAAAGLGFADVVKINTTVSSWRARPRYDETFARRFAEPFPAHAIVRGAPGVDGMLIEIEAVAVRGPRRVVRSALAPACHAVQVGNLVHLAGGALESLRRCLQDLDGRLEDVVKTNVTLADHRLLPAFDAEYGAFFRPPYPARTTVVAGLPGKGTLVAIEAVAVLGAAEESIAITGAG